MNQDEDVTNLMTSCTISEIYLQMVIELVRRLKLVVENNSCQSSLVFNSMTRFRMIMAPIGYPFGSESWMDEEYLKPIMTSEQFDSTEFNKLFEEMFKLGRYRACKHF